MWLPGLQFLLLINIYIFVHRCTELHVWHQEGRAGSCWWPQQGIFPFSFLSPPLFFSFSLFSPSFLRTISSLTRTWMHGVTAALGCSWNNTVLVISEPQLLLKWPRCSISVVNCQVLDGMACAVRFRDISLLVMQLGFSHDSSVMNII